ncbi:ATP-binding protein [Bacillus sp. MRMR6]|uniref:ATP-binding protein n=1 Tax=Bacillus sp. MRMR6 TaxID=1928617 RepID=UPI0009535C70|nr:hypothetical protein BTR25_12725 [Bacillus sp. MRMR6]
MTAFTAKTGHDQEETGGAGLGLSIAPWIVTKHDGTISVSRNQHKGTTFTVKLPKKEITKS